MLNRDYTVESVDTALQLLLILRRDGVVQLSPAAKELGVAKSTVHRLLGTLQRRGFVEQDPHRRYLIGPFLDGFKSGGASPVVLRASARRHLKELSREVHETVRLSILDGSSVRVIECVASDDPASTGIHTARIAPPHLSSAGMVILAGLPQDELANVLRAVPNAPSVAEISPKLAAIRSLGYAANLNEPERGVSAIAAPIQDPNSKTVGAVEVCIPTFRATAGKLRALSSGVIEAAALVGGELVKELPPTGVA